MNVENICTCKYTSVALSGLISLPSDTANSESMMDVIPGNSSVVIHYQIDAFTSNLSGECSNGYSSWVGQEQMKTVADTVPNSTLYAQKDNPKLLNIAWKHSWT